MTAAQELLSSLEIGSATDPGRKRKGAPNEDALLVLNDSSDCPPLFLVADGMGGYAGGAVASRMLVETAAAHYRQAFGARPLPDLLGECILEGHQALIRHAAANPDLDSMGTTAVLAVIAAGQVFYANVGDSRIYLIHPAPAASKDQPTLVPARAAQQAQQHVPEIEQISYDHSVVAEQVRAGMLTILQALHSPKRNRLTQSISPRRSTLTPYTGQAVFGQEDILVLCSDGLWGVISEATIAAIVRELPAQEAAEKLVAQAVSHGGPDNVSVIIVRRQRQADNRNPEMDETNPGL